MMKTRKNVLMRTVFLSLLLACDYTSSASLNDPEQQRKSGCEVCVVEYYSTIPLRESPYPRFQGVMRLSEKEAMSRNHYRFEYDENFNLKAISFRLGKELREPNHTANYFFTTPLQKFEYLDKEEVRTFYDRFGNQVGQRGAFKEVYQKDDLGRYMSLFFEDQEGERVENSWGIYEYKWEHQIDGSIIENRLDKDGSKVSLRPGFEFYIIRLFYDQNGFLALMQNIDEKGNLVENESGVAQDKLHFDSMGRWYGWSVLDSKNQLKRGNGPNVARGVNAPDKYGYEASIRYEDVDGSSIINAHGFWGSVRVYDNFGNYTYTQFLNNDGDPGTNEESGYSIARYTWSTDGLYRTSVSLLDVNEKPVSHKTRGYSKIKQEYDDEGKLIRSSFLGINGKLINRKDNGISFIEYVYDSSKKMTSTKAYDKDGNEIQ